MPQQQGKVVTEKKWNEEYSKIKTDCYDKRGSDANLLIALIDNKYTYNAELKQWEDPKSTSNSEGAKSPKIAK